MIFRKKYSGVIVTALAGAALMLSMTACSMQKNAENTKKAETVDLENKPGESNDAGNHISESQVAESWDGAKESESETMSGESALQKTENTVEQEQAGKEPKVTDPEPTASGRGTEPVQSQLVEYGNLQQIMLQPDWEYADHSKINSGAAVLYLASEESGRKNLIIGVNAGHGTSGGSKVKTLCHPDGSAKTTGGRSYRSDSCLRRHDISRWYAGEHGHIENGADFAR